MQHDLASEQYQDELVYKTRKRSLFSTLIDFKQFQASQNFQISTDFRLQHIEKIRTVSSKLSQTASTRTNKPCVIFKSDHGRSWLRYHQSSWGIQDHSFSVYFGQIRRFIAKCTSVVFRHRSATVCFWPSSRKVASDCEKNSVMVVIMLKKCSEL